MATLHFRAWERPFSVFVVLAVAALLLGPPMETLAESPYEVAWIRQLGTSSADYAEGVAVDAWGNAYIAGYTLGSLEGTNQGSYDAFLAKYSSLGNLLWKTQIGTPSYDYAYGVSVDGSGNPYITGMTTGSLGGTNQGGYDAFLVKYSSSGNLLWKTQLGTSDSDAALGMAADTWGNVYITGYTQGSLAGTIQGPDDAFLVKYSSSGDLLWKTQIGTGTYDAAYGISVDGSGNPYITGKTTGSFGGTNAGNYDVFLAKYSSTGGLLWKTQIGTSSEDSAEGVAVDGSGNAYVTGHTPGSLGGTNQGSLDAFLVKYSSSGDLLWTTQIGTSSYDAAYGVSVDRLGKVYVTGGTRGSLGGTSLGSQDAFLANYSSTGGLLWKIQIGTSSSDYAEAVAVDGSGRAYITGATAGPLGGPNAGGADAFLVKLRPPPPTVGPRPTESQPNSGEQQAIGFLPSSDRLRYYSEEDGTWQLLFPATFDPDRPTYILVHGGAKGLVHQDSLADMTSIASAIAARDPNSNILGWDWEDMVSWNDRLSARRAGNEQGAVLAETVKALGLSSGQTILIGDGIGGHLVSSAAALLGSESANVSRVVLLDTYMFWEWGETPGYSRTRTRLRNVEQVDNVFYGRAPGGGHGVTLVLENGFDGHLNWELAAPFAGTRDWYREAIELGIRIDGTDLDVLTHEYKGYAFECLFRRMFDSSGLGPGLWMIENLPDPHILLDVSDLSPWTAQNATAVTVAGAWNRESADAIRLQEGSDAYIWREVTVPGDAVYLTFDAMLEGGCDGDLLIVSFAGETLFLDDPGRFDDRGWMNVGAIYVGDLAGQTGPLQFWLRSAGDSDLGVLISNVGFAVPEPGALLLLALGGLGLIRRRRN